MFGPWARYESLFILLTNDMCQSERQTNVSHTSFGLIVWGRTMLHKSNLFQAVFLLYTDGFDTIIGMGIVSKETETCWKYVFILGQSTSESVLILLCCLYAHRMPRHIRFQLGLFFAFPSSPSSNDSSNHFTRLLSFSKGITGRQNNVLVSFTASALHLRPCPVMI